MKRFNYTKWLIDHKHGTPLKEGIRKIIKIGVLQPKWATSEREYTIDDYL